MDGICVSVVIPTYERANLIRSTLESVARQKFSNFEVIIVDDASSDVGELKKVAEQVLGGCIPYKLICHSENRHGGAARNTGIREAKGKYIALLDSDDLWSEDKLSKTVSILESDKTVDYVYSRITHEQSNSQKIIKPKRGIRSDESVADYLLYKGHCMQTSSIVLRRASTVEQGVMFDENLRRFQDYDLVILLDEHNKKAGFVEESLVFVSNIDDGHRISNSIDLNLIDFWLDKVESNISEKALSTFLVDRKARLLLHNERYRDAWNIIFSKNTLAHCRKSILFKVMAFSFTPKWFRKRLIALKNIYSPR